MRQFLARNPRTYWLPRLAIEPSRTAALAVRSQMSLASSGRQPRVRRLAHQAQRLLDALLGDEAEERRLFELYRQPLAKRPVEHRVAGRVREIGEDNRVLVRESWRGGANRGNLRRAMRPAGAAAAATTTFQRLAMPRAVAGSALVVTRRRIRVALQALEVGADVRRVLVAQGAILLEALVDDALQFRRHVGIQAHRGARERG